MHPGDRDRVSADIQEAMKRGGVYRCDRVRQHDGSFRWIEANGRAELNEEGRAVRFPGILMDT
ncbi:PAS domain-containing protein [Pseudomonas protegens]|uniref:PAS domain-containing protein n=1 Tax=Pseudomonas protegens TaxID=380021 RepID=UPI00288346F9|nr:PAS domain-containing protein [Pseudomonas protegens]